MGTIKFDSIMGKARKILTDAGAATWTNQDLLDFMNTGQREIIKANNGTSVATENITCVVGSKQTVPGLRLLDVTRNMGANGTTAGKPITKMDREVLDALVPTWHTLTAVDEAIHYVTGEDDNVFYLYPPIKANQQVETVQIKLPADVILANTTTAAITVDDTFEGAMIDYVCGRAFSFGAALPGMRERSQSHMQAFYASIGMEEQGTKKASTKATERRP